MKLFRKEIFTDHDGRPPYMIRWTLIKRKNWQLFLHKFLRTDDDCMHDHPWDFMSIILKGKYVEYTKEKLTFLHSFCSNVPSYFRIYYRGEIIKRKAINAHRIALLDKNPCWTLCLTFKPIRDWGFYTPSGWKSWRRYIVKGRKSQCMTALNLLEALGATVVDYKIIAIPEGWPKRLEPHQSYESYYFEVLKHLTNERV